MCYLVAFENLNDKKNYWIFLEILFILKIDQLTAYSQIKKPKRSTIQKMKISKFILTG